MYSTKVNGVKAYESGHMYVLTYLRYTIDKWNSTECVLRLI